MLTHPFIILLSKLWLVSSFSKKETQYQHRFVAELDTIACKNQSYEFVTVLQMPTFLHESHLSLFPTAWHVSGVQEEP